MSQLSIHSISIAFGGFPVLDKVSLDIQKGQRISILGRNGTGKSTLLKILSGELQPDNGEIINSTSSRITLLPQDIPLTITGTAYEVVASGAGNLGADFARLHKLIKEDRESAQIIELQSRIEQNDGWGIGTVIERLLSFFQIDEDFDYSSLSGGMKRKVFLARALAGEPDILLLDEPTNHLDIETISKLEDYIIGSNLTVIFVTHDRRLLRKLATRIIEVDRGNIFDWSCDYQTFLERKDAQLEAEQKEWERFDKKLAQEEIWIRRGIKARRTRNEGRVRALKKMREERKKRRQQSGKVSMQISEAQRSGNKVIEAQNISFSYDSKKIVNDFSSTITRGDRIGIIGPNGCGKTTLLNILLGNLKPQKGIVTVGESVEATYFDQLRDILDPEKTVWENTVPSGGDTVFVNGSPKHIISYLQDFLFTPDRAKSPVKQLSGGERNRLMLARLFTNPSNLLVLDEPTNDLDTETLELLEELLLEFRGTVLVVSHDREFLNNVVSSIIAYEGEGGFKEYVGGYDDWIRQTTQLIKNQAAPKKAKQQKPKTPDQKKLSYKEKKTLEELPKQIEKMETEFEKLSLEMANPDNFQKPGFITEAQQRLEILETEISSSYLKWEELESRSDRNN
ncbi:ABC transporter ATP-binding protein [Chitinispirillum alkaliphilum]|nr:ABC transporter ATP-binding protein [Chitinispirillum alkaliphilum]